MSDNKPIESSFDSSSRITEQHLQIIKLESQESSKVGSIFNNMDSEVQEFNISIEKVETVEEYEEYYENITKLEKALKVIDEIETQKQSDENGGVYSNTYPTEQLLTVLEMHKNFGVDLTKLSEEELEKLARTIMDEKISEEDSQK